ILQLDDREVVAIIGGRVDPDELLQAGLAHRNGSQELLDACGLDERLAKPEIGRVEGVWRRRLLLRGGRHIGHSVRISLTRHHNLSFRLCDLGAKSASSECFAPRSGPAWSCSRSLAAA